ncbi:unnamed protein product [Cuscuta epithymum]|uniref:DUF4283 domain-containing protein n=1 Tax=Cuscuta epithymum TaxID=186058 RepID=A0AAV0DQ61_9ASTE|nr:unnamed protein product [Cuscuta epithymum]
MAMVWRPVKGVSIDEIEDSKFLLQFYHEGDLNSVVDKGPWSFQQNLVVIRRLERTDKPLEVALDHADFWVQVHDLPLSYMTTKAARGVANIIGSFVQMDESSSGGKQRLVMRIRVTLNITLALVRRLQVRQECEARFGQILNLKDSRTSVFCVGTQAIMDVDDAASKNLEVAVLTGQHRQ